MALPLPFSPSVTWLAPSSIGAGCVGSVMKIIEQVNSSYTLCEDDDGTYLMTVVVPAAGAAWAVFEKEYRLSIYERFLVRLFPSKIKKLATRILLEEQKLR
ncbi:hypothetical protein [Duganella sp. CF458]|uniref:hypothetical protein n=1 Tax=Duganella sp. CF458 TaxID=1884368 RepID=UPI001113696B|nr:hypothetical protein [Duganella sp. CF458]